MQKYVYDTESLSQSIIATVYNLDGWMEGTGIPCTFDCWSSDNLLYSKMLTNVYHLSFFMNKIVTHDHSINVV